MLASLQTIQTPLKMASYGITEMMVGSPMYTTFLSTKFLSRRNVIVNRSKCWQVPSDASLINYKLTTTQKMLASLQNKQTHLKMASFGFTDIIVGSSVYSNFLSSKWHSWLSIATCRLAVPGCGCFVVLKMRNVPLRLDTATTLIQWQQDLKYSRCHSV